MIRALLCLFVAKFALVSSADLVDRVVDFGTVRAGTDLCKYIALLSEEPVLSAEIDFGCACGSASFIQDENGSGLYLRYAPSLRNGPFVKRLEVSVSTTASGEPEIIPILLKGSVWLPVIPSAAYLDLEREPTSVQFKADKRISSPRILSASLTNPGVFQIDCMSLPCAIGEGDVMVSVGLSDRAYAQRHSDTLRVKYSFADGDELCEGEIKIPVFFSPAIDRR